MRRSGHIWRLAMYRLRANQTAFLDAEIIF